MARTESTSELMIGDRLAILGLASKLFQSNETKNNSENCKAILFCIDDFPNIIPYRSTWQLLGMKYQLYFKLYRANSENHTHYTGIHTLTPTNALHDNVNMWEISVVYDCSILPFLNYTRVANVEKYLKANSNYGLRQQVYLATRQCQGSLLLGWPTLYIMGLLTEVLFHKSKHS